jgi:hypothetical protein
VQIKVRDIENKWREVIIFNGLDVSMDLGWHDKDQSIELAKVLEEAVDELTEGWE